MTILQTTYLPHLAYVFCGRPLLEIHEDVTLGSTYNQSTLTWCSRSFLIGTRPSQNSQGNMGSAEAPLSLLEEDTLLTFLSFSPLWILPRKHEKYILRATHFPYTIWLLKVIRYSLVRKWPGDWSDKNGSGPCSRIQCWESQIRDYLPKLNCIYSIPIQRHLRKERSYQSISLEWQYMAQSYFGLTSHKVIFWSEHTK